MRGTKDKKNEEQNKTKKETQRKRKGERRSHDAIHLWRAYRDLRGPESSITPPEADGKPLEKVADGGTVRKAESLGEMVANGRNERNCIITPAP